MLDRRNGAKSGQDKIDACHMQSKEETTSCLGKKSPSKHSACKQSESTFADFDDDGPSVDDIIGELHRNTSYMAISQQMNQLPTDQATSGKASMITSGGTLARNYATIGANYAHSNMPQTAHSGTEATLGSQGLATFAVDAQTQMQSIVGDPTQLQPYRNSTYAGYAPSNNYEQFAFYAGNATTIQSPHHIGLANYPTPAYSYTTDPSSVSPQHILLANPAAQSAAAANQLLLRPISGMISNSTHNHHASSTFQPLSIHLLTATTTSPVRASPAALSNHTASPNVSYADTCGTQTLPPQPQPLPSPHLPPAAPQSQSLGAPTSGSIMTISNCGPINQYGPTIDTSRGPPTMLISTAAQQQKPIDPCTVATMQLTTGHCPTSADGTNLSSSSSSNSAISSHTASTVLSHMSTANGGQMGTLKRHPPPPVVDSNCGPAALNTYF